jgi:heme/copper-type cytochrome/quinol oxidase subunit 2
MEQTENVNLFELQLDQSSINYLNEASRWSRFLSILGFIYIGLLIIAGILFGSFGNSLMPGSDAEMPMRLSGVFISLIFILMALVLFIPVLYLFNFSSKMRKALRNNDQPVLTEALKNLKSFFKFYGILAIVGLSFYALAIVAAVIGGLVSHRA